VFYMDVFEGQLSLEDVFERYEIGTLQRLGEARSRLLEEKDKRRREIMEDQERERKRQEAANARKQRR